MTEKVSYKYSIKFSQSLTAGTIAFEGYYAFDDKDEYDPMVLLKMLEDTEDAFAKEGYKVASIIPNNMRDLANRKSELQLAKEVNKLESEQKK